MKSLRLRLIILFVAVEFCVIFVMSAMVYHRSRKAMIDALDAGVASHIMQFASEIQEGEPDDHIIDELSDEQRAKFRQGRTWFYQIVRGNGEVVLRSPSLRDEIRSLPDDWVRMDVGEPHCEFEEWDDEEVRVGTMVVSATVPHGADITPSNLDEILIVQVGTETEEMQDKLEDLIEYLSMIGGVLLLVSVVVGYWLATWSFRPVRRLGERIRQITERNLGQRLPEEDVPVEIRPLSESFNEMLTRLEAAFERERRFLADASHELRTPVSVAMSVQEVALKKQREPEAYVEALEKSLGATVRLKSLVERMMEISRTGRTLPSESSDEIDLVSVVDEVVDFIQPMAAANGVEIHWERPASPLVIRGDRLMLQELVENLISNGIIHNRVGGSVNVALERPESGGGATLLVRDTGVGIAPEHLPHIFDRFYRVDKARSRAKGGSGLGLAIAKGIAEAHGGSLSVTSELGSGSEFTVWLLGTD